MTERRVTCRKRESETADHRPAAAGVDSGTDAGADTDAGGDADEDFSGVRSWG
jgi:hypothetical protein